MSSERNQGKPVDLVTVKALLTDAALARIHPRSHRFCPAPDCPVVYFDDHGEIFSTSDLCVPVWQKEPVGRRTVCYCFGENEADIREEIARNGTSKAQARVAAHIKAGRCACEERNPEGSCCLGDVIEAVKRVEAIMQEFGHGEPALEPNT